VTKASQLRKLLDHVIQNISTVFTLAYFVKRAPSFYLNPIYFIIYTYTKSQETEEFLPVLQFILRLLLKHPKYYIVPSLLL
jgi:hypothetical protein